MNTKNLLMDWSDFLDERYHPRLYQLFLFSLFSGLVLFGVFSSVDSGQAHVFGYAVPPLCMFKRITSFDCPGCGMTRAFIMTLHGRFEDAFWLHLWGIPMTGIVLAQIPYRFWRAVGGAFPSLKLSTAAIKRIKYAVILSVFLPWIIKTTVTISSMLR